MSNDVLITPASRKIEFKDSSSNIDAKIETDSNGNLVITNPGGDISLGDTTADVFIGDGANSVDLVFEQSGEIRGTSGVTITLGATGSNVRMASDLNLNSKNITNVNDITIAGNLTVNGTTVTNSATNTTIEDALIELGSGNTGANSNDLGLILERGTTGNNIFIGWDESEDKVAFGTTTATGSSTGDISYSRASILANALDLTNHIDIADNGKIRLGAGDDLQLYHNGTDSAIDNLTGDLYITNTANDKDIIFRSDDGSGGYQTYFLLDGSTAKTQFNRHLKIIDSMQIQVGTNPDMLLYHDGTDSYIDNNTGDLYIRGQGDDLILRANDDIHIQPQGNDNGISLIGNGGVKVYYDSSQKLETTSLGINIGSGGSTDYSRVSFVRAGGSGVGAIGWHSDSKFYVAGHPGFGTTAGNAVRVYGFGSNIHIGDNSNGDVITVQYSSGNVGISNTTPDDKLSISGGDVSIYGSTSSGLVTHRTLHFHTSDGAASLSNSNKQVIGEIAFSGHDGSLNAAGKYAHIKSYVIDANSQIQGSANEGGQLEFTILRHDVSTEARVEYTALTIDNSANVGIGTNSPDENLHIKDTGNADLKIERASGAVVFAQAQASVGVLGTSTNSRLDLKTNSTTRMTVATSGNVGIGTSSPGTLLHLSNASDPTVRVQDSSSGMVVGLQANDSSGFVGTTTNSDFGIRTNNSTRLHVENSGNVGIGTTTPYGKLNINTGTSGSTSNISSQLAGSWSFANQSSGTAAPALIGKSNNNVGALFIGATNDGNTSGDMHFNVRENDGTDFATTTSTAFKFQRYTTDLMTILRNGRVTIGSRLYLSNQSNNYLEHITNYLQHNTSHGYIQIGPGNTSYAHIQTDRPQFYFNKKLVVNEGIITSYDEDLIFRRASSSSQQITISTGAVTSTLPITTTGEGKGIGHQYKKEYFYDEIVGDADGSDNKFTLKDSDGNDLTPTTINKVYRVRLVTLGTGTNTGAVYIADNVNGDNITDGNWRINAVNVHTNPTEGSNYPLLELDSNVPKVSIQHNSNYTVRIFIEEYNVGNRNGHHGIFGTDHMLTAQYASKYLGVNRDSPSYTLDVGGSIGINGTNIITSSRNMLNIGSFSSGAITSSSTITSSGTITTSGSLKAGNSEVLQRNVNGWTVPVQSILYNGYGSNLNDYLYVKVPGNSTSAHGIALITDNAFYYGRDNRETGAITNDANAPLNESVGMKVNYEGQAYFKGKVGINTFDPDGQGYSFAEDLVIMGGNSASDGVGLTLRGNGKRYGVIAFGDNADDNAGEIWYDHDNNSMNFRTAGTLNATLGSTGNFDVKNGDLKMGNISVITAARNITNIGTVNCGSMIATGAGLAPQLQIVDSDNTTGRLQISHNSSTSSITSVGTSGLGSVAIGGSTSGTGSTYATFNSSGTVLGGITSQVGIGGTPADANSFELGRGYLNLARDDTATAKQLVFAKNGAVHSYLETSTSAFSIRSDTVIQFLTAAGGSAQNVRTKSLFAGSTYGDVPPAGSVNAVNTYELNGVTVIDSSRNLTSIGQGSFSGTVTIDQGASFSKLDIGTSRTGATENIGAVRFLNASDTLKAQVLGTNDGKLRLGTNGSTTALTLDASQNATFAGDVLINEPNPTLILQDTTDDDDHGIRFRDNGGTDRYSITTLNDSFNFITEGSRELIFKPAGTEKFRVGAAYNESKQDLRFPDNAILRLGTGTDLNIYHNGTDSLINNDTGDLYIQNYTDDGDIRFYSDNGSGGTAEYIRCDGGLGQVKLFHYGSEKFITTSAGIKVTGEVNLTGELEINGTDVIDSSRNLTNIASYTGGTVKITSASMIRNSSNNDLMSYSNNNLTVGDASEEDAVEVLNLITMAGVANVHIDGNNEYVGFFGTQSSSYEARIASNGTMHLDSTLTQNSGSIGSDIKLKKNIQPVESALDTVEKLRGVHFEWKKSGKEAIGFIAQEVEEILPQLVQEADLLGEEDETFKSLDYVSIIPILVEAIKEQQKEIKELKEHSHPAKDMCEFDGYQELMARIEKLEENNGNK